MYAKTKIKGSIQFTVKGRPETRAAAVAGDFNGWKPALMRKQKDGSFFLTLKVPPGRYQYKFLLDGDWVHDTEVPDVVLNQFGTFNSVCAVD